MRGAKEGGQAVRCSSSGLLSRARDAARDSGFRVRARAPVRRVWVRRVRVRVRIRVRVRVRMRVRVRVRVRVRGRVARGARLQLGSVDGL